MLFAPVCGMADRARFLAASDVNCIIRQLLFTRYQRAVLRNRHCGFNRRGISSLDDDEVGDQQCENCS
jgi:hypothetical protein